MSQAKIRLYRGTIAAFLWLAVISAIFLNTGNIPVAYAASPNIVISQVYGGGGNSGATYTHDFIEIFNRGPVSVDVTGWSVQYASSTGTSWQVTTLSGTIPSGRYYLIQQAVGTGGTTALPTPDATGNIAMSATSGKVALVRNNINIVCIPSSTSNCISDPDIVDFLGYGTSANNFEGAGTTANLSNTNSAARNGAGCTDTDRNNLDFTVGAAFPNARNSATTAVVCNLAGTISANNPAPSSTATLLMGAGPSAIVSSVATFRLINNDTTVSQDYSIAFSGITGLEISIDGVTFSSVSPLTGTLPAGGNITVSVRVANPTANGTGTVIVTNTTTASDPINTSPSGTYNVSLTVVGSLTTIPNIQGEARTTPLALNTTVATTGTITGIKDDGFFMQDATGDSNDNTSDGIFVLTKSKLTLPLGTDVEVVGEVRENFNNTAIGALSVRELGTTAIITPVRITTDPAVTTSSTVRRVPTVIYDGSLCTTYTPSACGLDFYESLEGMVVQINNANVVAPTNNFGEFALIPDNGVGATGFNTRRAIAISNNGSTTDFNPEWVFVDDGIVSTPQLHVGDKTTTNIVGPLDFTFNNFKIQPTTTLPTFDTSTRANTETITALNSAGQLRVVSYNIENFDLSDGARRDLIATQIRVNLASPDIIIMTEVQDDDGATNSSTVSADNNLNDLVTRISNAGGPTYSFRYVNPVDDQDGGEPGGNIRQVFFFRTDRGLAFVDKAGGTSTTANTVLGDGSLQYSPGRIDPTNSAFASSRKPVAGEFTFQGQRLIVIGNHLNSKGGDGRLYGTTQPPVLSSETQRNSQATIIRNFVTSIITADPNAKVIVGGDLNDFEFSNPLKILKNNNGVLTGTQVLSNSIETIPVDTERYTYIFEGNAQVLDHILYSQPLASRVITADIVHMNSDKPSSDPNKASDHEAVVVTFSLNDPPVISSFSDPITTVTQNAPTFSLSITGTDDLGVYSWSSSPITGVSGVTITNSTTASPTFSVTVTTGFSGTASFVVTLTDTVNTPVTKTVNIAVTSFKGTVKLLSAPQRIAIVPGTATGKLVGNVNAPSVGNANTVSLTIGGVGSIPANAKGVIGVLTNLGCTAGGNLRFWTGNTTPDAANLNVPGANPALNVSASFITPLDATGKVNLGLQSAGTCGYVVDVNGYVTDADAGSDSIKLLSATQRITLVQGTATNKLVGNVNAPVVGTANTVSLTIGGVGSIPAGAKGVIGVLTNLGCTAGGNLRFWTGNITPDAANLNVPGANPAINASASFVTPLDSAGKVNLGLQSAGTCGYVVDVTGYIVPAGQGENLNLLSATQRITIVQGTATNKLVGNVNAPVVGNANTTSLTIGGVGSIPANAKGTIGTLTNLGCTAGGNLRFWTGNTTPDAANLNVPSALPSLNLSASFSTPLDSAGKVNLGLQSAGTCGYVVDVNAYLS